ncbi:class I SAM-dependent methyltransferase [Elongatibacter sediminis]|uniref:Class I SAM-dependent methyltransferase n=1 Tax=Elongatibacter sediminis TaxID=3119006 RepID=A0AAW9RKJ1_9GAMM
MDSSDAASLWSSTNQQAPACMNAEIVHNCPACLSDEHRQVALPDLNVCKNCSLYFRTPRPTQAAILKSYESGLTFSRWQDELPARTFLWEKRLQLILRHMQSGNLLDIGTGDGFFLQFAKRHFDTQATEISKTGVRQAQAHGHRVHHGQLADFPDRYQNFDVITLWHVLEHVPAPRLLMKDIRHRLTPNGIVAVAIPNELTPILRDRVKRTRKSPAERHSLGQLAFGEEIHLTHFTPAVFKAFLRQLGFRILDFGIDDVHVDRPARKVAKYHINRAINAACKVHFDSAMYAICSPAPLAG